MNIVNFIKNKDFFNNSKYMLANSFLNFSLKIISSILIVRYIGADNNGIYAYIYATFTIFSGIADFGLESLIVREGTIKKYEPGKILGSAIVFRFITGIISSVLFLVYIYTRGYDSEYMVYSFWVLISDIGRIFYVFRTYMISQYDAKDFYLSQNICSVFFFICRILFVYYECDFVLIFIINTLESCVSGIIYSIIYGKRNKMVLSFSYDIIKMYIKEGLPLTVAGLAIVIYMRCDQIMVRNILGENALGVYSVAVLLAEFWYFIPSTINTSVSPRIIAILESGDENRIESCFGIYYRLMFLISVCAGIIISLLSKALIILFYGLEYYESSNILKIYIWAGVFVCLGLARNNYLIFKKYNAFNAVITIVACIINIILNYLLIPTWAGYGAAVSTVISYFFSAMLSSIIWPKTKKNGLIQLKALFYPYIYLYFKSKKCKQNL